MSIRRALKEGHYACGAAHIGYSWDRSEIRPMIKPNENAKLVKEACGLYSTAGSHRRFVAKRLTSHPDKSQTVGFFHRKKKESYCSLFICR